MSSDIQRLEPQILRILTSPETNLSTASAKLIRSRLRQSDPLITEDFVKQNKSEIDSLIVKVFNSVYGIASAHDLEKSTPPQKSGISTGQGVKPPPTAVHLRHSPGKVLVANRGEIAIRILRSARELGWKTVAVYTEGDATHASYAHEAVKLGSTSDYMSIDNLVSIAERTQCTHLHPGYGFLSENADFAAALAHPNPSSSSVSFVGPSVDALRISSDKMLSRDLATSLSVPVALGRRVSSASEVEEFVHSIDPQAGSITGYPIILKAIDGGGGRGIRVVDRAESLEAAFKRCLGESPSKQLFVEKALVGPGWKHIEVQVVGDGTGDATHLHDRECSVQRRFQKVIEMAPSTLSRERVQPLFDASLKMARSMKYQGLGTFEFLLHASSGQWVFLEINPRIQVEHTVTEEVTGLDLVRIQLLLSSGATLESLKLSSTSLHGHAIQLRVTAEDPSRSFQLSTGTIHNKDIRWPGGRGVRIDTWLSSFPEAGNSWTVGTEFDSLLAKVIVHGRDFEETTQRAIRVMEELWIAGDVITNASLLAAVVGHPDWIQGAIDTTWLERNAEALIESGAACATSRKAPISGQLTNESKSSSSFGSVSLQPGSSFNLSMSPLDPSSRSLTPSRHLLMLTSIEHNSFPDQLSGTLQTSFSSSPLNFSLTQSSSVAISSASFELADPSNPLHFAFPLTGKIVELHPALLADNSSEARLVKEGDTLAVLSVMKMESVISATRTGFIERIGAGIQVGAVIGEGVLLAIFSPDKYPKNMALDGVCNRALKSEKYLEGAIKNAG